MSTILTLHDPHTARRYHADGHWPSDISYSLLDERDAKLRLGLVYPESAISLPEPTGLGHHHDVTQALLDAAGDPAYAPARRARVATDRA